MNQPSAGGDGFASLRRAGQALLEMAEVRVDLFGTEVEHEKARAARGLVLAAAAWGLGVLALLLFSVAAVLLAPPPWRLAVLLGLAVAYAAAAAVLARAAGAALRTPEGGAFALTRAELRRDLDSLRAPARG